MSKSFWIDAAAALAGVCFGFFLHMIYEPNPIPNKECSLYKVEKKPVTSYVLKPVVQEAQCSMPDRIVVKEKCDPPAAEAEKEPEQKIRRRKRRWR